MENIIQGRYDYDSNNCLQLCMYIATYNIHMYPLIHIKLHTITYKLRIIARYVVASYTATCRDFDKVLIIYIYIYIYIYGTGSSLMLW